MCFVIKIRMTQNLHENPNIILTLQLHVTKSMVNDKAIHNSFHELIYVAVHTKQVKSRKQFSLTTYNSPIQRKHYTRKQLKTEVLSQSFLAFAQYLSKQNSCHTNQHIQVNQYCYHERSFYLHDLPLSPKKFR